MMTRFPKDDNLLQETAELLQKNGLKLTDILWVGNTEMWTTGDRFIKIAHGCNYGGGFGSQEVAADLLVVGTDWWLERHEYDGSEWWEFKRLPEKPIKTFQLGALSTNQSPAGDYRTDLLEMNPETNAEEE